MTDKLRNIATTVFFVAFLAITSLSCFLKPSEEVSESERRKLQQFPIPTWSSIADTSFMSDFETYTLDQFPARDSFRTLKSIAHYFFFAQMDNNDIYLSDGSVSKLEYPLKENSITSAAGKFEKLYDMYFADTDAKVYYSVIPDKNYFLAEQSGHPSMDYDRLLTLLGENTEHLSYIDIFPYLTIEDYYTTDTHWRQESILDVADALASAMGVTLTETEDSYKKNAYDPFYGVYYGQAALPMAPDTLYYLSSPVLDGCTVYNHETKKTTPVYDLDRLRGSDPYDVFLSGAAALLTIENPNCETDRELVIFRDSFGSSITPLLLSGYKTVTVVDIRYVMSDLVGTLVDLSGTDDVLFLYSTMVLNNSTMLK